MSHADKSSLINVLNLEMYSHSRVSKCKTSTKGSVAKSMGVSQKQFTEQHYSGFWDVMILEVGYTSAAFKSTITINVEKGLMLGPRVAKLPETAQCTHTSFCRQ